MESNALEKLKEAISIYYVNNFGEYPNDEDFDDLSYVPLAYTTTSDYRHAIQVSFDLINSKLIYKIDDNIIHTEKYDSLDEMLMIFGEDGSGLSFAKMAAEAEDIWEGMKYGKS